MKLTFVANACCLYESDGFRLLADPWLVPGAFGTWTHDPPLQRDWLPELLDVDALYISHIHPDHCDEATLKHFRRDIRIITLEDKLSLCRKHLQKMGFTKIIGLAHREEHYLNPFWITMFEPFCKHPFFDENCEIGNVVDSAITIHDDKHQVLNCNDNTLSLDAAICLHLEYGPFDVAQLNWNNAGPYPACFRNLREQEKLDEAETCIARNLNHMSKVARILAPKYVMPFAGTYKLGFGKEHLNPYLGTTTAQAAAEYLERKGIQTLVLGEGESFDCT